MINLSNFILCHHIKPYDENLRNMHSEKNKKKSIEREAYKESLVTIFNQF